MLKKLFVTAAAAAAVSVPLAGLAWADDLADPGDPNGIGIGAGGVPETIGGTSPGSLFSSVAQLKEGIGLPFFAHQQPGQVVKTGTPGDGNGTQPPVPGVP